MASSLDLTDRGELRLLADLVNAIRSTRPDARFLLVGAMARDLLLWFAHGIRAQRATEDFDFAFAVQDWHSFKSLRGALIASDLFEEVPGVTHRVVFAGHRVDLIPFGGVENPVGTIDWPAPQDTRMVVLGFREAMDSAVDARLPGGVVVAVASLPALAILKLFAWDDRRYTQHGKDAGDLWLLLRNYLEAGNRKRLYCEASHLFQAEDYDDDLAGAWLLGADARKLLLSPDGSSSVALTRASTLLAGDEVDGPVHLAADMDTLDLQHSIDILRAFRAGLNGAMSVNGS